MTRREFIAFVGGVAAWPLAAHAQQAIPVIGYLHAATASEIWLKRDAEFRRGLGEVGYTEGRNLTIEARWAGDQYDRLPAMAADLTQRDVALIAAFTTPAARAAKAVTAKIPIVFTTISNPVQIGLVASLNRPGGNLTGVSLLSVEIGPKLLELLRTAIPSATIMAMLINPTNPNAETQLRNTQEAARKLGLQLHVLNANTERDLDVAFEKLHELRASALVIGQDVFFNTSTIYPDREFAEAGGLMSYGADQLDAFRQVGVYAGRILKGERPADLPVIQASKFELLINLKTARTLGLTLSPDVLSIANEVIE